MKQNLLLIATVLMAFTATAQLSGGGEANPGLKTNQKSLEKFMDMGFGMFIHWGPVTLRGTEISWSRGKQVAIEDYDTLYEEFNPVLFNAADWVKAAKEAGMQYVVLTTRHHDGFSLWDSAFSDYDMANTPYAKDIVGAVAQECKKQGITFGAYYSICDWHHDDYPVTYPAADYKLHTERVIKDPETKMRMDRYITFIKNQLKELIENYDPAFIWFDGEWEWAWTHEMGMDMYSYLRGLKDDLLINNRVDKGREGMAGTTSSSIYAGDYATPEQRVGNFDTENAWETCMTIANQWSWKPNDPIKSKEECIQTLVRTVGGGGNLLFNVGPMPDGRIEKRQVHRLKEMGDWLAVNGDAIYGTRGGPYQPNDYMVSTHKGNKVFIHFLKNPEAKVTLPFPKDFKVEKAYFLDGGNRVGVLQTNHNLTIEMPEKLSDDTVSVVVLELDRPATGMGTIKRINY